jgi:hypothetical protein
VGHEARYLAACRDALGRRETLAQGRQIFERLVEGTSKIFELAPTSRDDRARIAAHHFAGLTCESLERAGNATCEQDGDRCRDDDGDRRREHDAIVHPIEALFERPFRDRCHDPEAAELAARCFHDQPRFVRVARERSGGCDRELHPVRLSDAVQGRIEMARPDEPQSLVAEPARAARHQRGFRLGSRRSVFEVGTSKQIAGQRRIDRPGRRGIVRRPQDLARPRKEQELVQVQRFSLLRNELAEREPPTGRDLVARQLDERLIDVRVVGALRPQRVAHLRRFPLELLQYPFFGRLQLLLELLLFCPPPSFARDETYDPGGSEREQSERDEQAQRERHRATRAISWVYAVIFAMKGGSRTPDSRAQFEETRGGVPE